MKTSGLFVCWAGNVIGLIENATISGKPGVVIVFIEALSESFAFNRLNLQHF